VRRLTRRQVLLLHAQLLEATGGAPGIRDDGLLDSALAAPDSAFEGTEFYPTAEAKAARVAFGLVSNHPFVDGNKRVGILAMLVLLGVNGVAVEADDDELIALGLALACGETDAEGVLVWIEAHVEG
jgi:death-on-curing protein